MIEFIGNDQQYLQWLAAQPQAYVLNCRKTFDGYYKVHRSTCSFISVPKKNEPGEFTEHRYIKVVAPSLEELKLWLAQKDRDADIYQHLCPCTSRNSVKN